MAYMPKEDEAELYIIKLEKQGTKWTKEEKSKIYSFLCQVCHELSSWNDFLVSIPVKLLQKRIYGLWSLKYLLQQSLKY